MMLGVVGFFHSAYALPQIDGAAPAGVTIASEGSTMNIGSSAANNVLNWKTFSIGESEKVAFDAQNYLNLVTGTEASSILGQLTGGGSVYLINPNGILFGANAKVDVGAFYASTRNIDAVNTAAFAASGTNPLLTTVSEVGGDIINRGNIAANQIVLEGDHISIQNYENIQNSAGEVLNSDAVTLKATESGNIHVGYNITKYRYDNNTNNIDYDYDGNYAATSTTKKDGVTANGMYYWGTSQENNHPTFNYAATTLDGTAITATPYALIHNIYEWENLNQVSWGPSNFMLANDIDGTNYTYTPITHFDARTPHLDGLGYTIKNLSYEAVSGGSPVGLFITLKDATVENLNIASSTSFKAYQEDVSAGWRHAGSLAYETIGNVLLRNVHSSANVTNGRTIGGLVAFNRGGGLTIMDSSFDGTVTGSSDVGGLVGSHAGSSIYETGKLTIKNSYNTGSISYDTTNASTGDALHMGGLVGTSAGGLSIVNSYNTGTIDSSAAKNITGSETYVGGLAGYVYQSRGKDNYTIEKSYNTGDVIAYNPNSESYAFAGGLFGYYQNDSDTALAISEVYNAGNVKAQATAVNGTKGNQAIGAYAGGLIGYSKGSDGSGEEALTIKNAYAAKLAGGATAAVTISGGTKGSGGIIGFVDGTDGKTSINNSYWYSSAGMGAYGDRITTDGNDYIADSNYITVNTSGILDYASALAAYKADSESNPNPNARDTYTALGWDIGNNGGESTVWRIFNLHTPPMLRTFLKPKSVAANVTVTKEYNGTAQSVNYSDLNALGIYGDTTGSLGNTTFGSQTNAGTAVIGYNDNSPNSLSALTWSGQDGVDYDDINFTITPKNVSVSFANPTKEYDGTATASIANPTLTGLISSDSGSVSVSAASAAYDSKNAGTGKIVTYTGLTLAGDKAANYSLTNNAVKGTGTITQKTLNASLEAISKVYDGTTNAAAPTPTLTGVVDGDSVSVTASGSYDSKNVGSRTVNYTLNLSGTDAANYSLSGTATGEGTIHQKALTANVEAISKVYDGTTNAAAPTPTLTGVVDGDSVSVTASGSYDSKNVGSRTVNYTLNLSGTDAANYSLSGTATGEGTIHQKALTANVEAISKVYDGTTNATAPTPTLTGVVDGDNVSVTASGSYDSKNAGSRTVNYTLNLSGTDAANYSLSGTTTGAGTITLRPVILTAEATEIIRGEAIPELTGSASNMVAGEPAPTWSTTADSSSRSGQYPIIGALDSSIAGNYEVTQASGNAIALTIKVNPDIPEGPTPEEPTVIPTEPKEIAGVMADRSIYRNNPVNVGQDAAVVAAKESSTPASPQAAATSVTSGENTSVMTVTEETGTTEVKDNADSEKNK